MTATPVDVVDEDPDEASCRVCGCSEQDACAGGCWWVPDPELEGDLCCACLCEDCGLVGAPDELGRCTRCGRDG